MNPASRVLVGSAIAGLIAVAAAATISSNESAVPSTTDAVSSRFASSSQPVVDDYVHAVANRLNIMPEVAYTKYVKKLPIDDPVREKALADSFVGRAVAAGVPEAMARSVITDQFTAGKAVQYRLFEQWKSGKAELPKHEPLDLATQIRPMVDNATDQLLGQLLAIVPLVHDSDWSHNLNLAAQRADGVLSPTVSPAELREALKSLG